jgi:hypothetical protein
MNTCSQCLEDYPADGTEWIVRAPHAIVGSYWCGDCLAPLCGDHLVMIKDCGCQI